MLITVTSLKGGIGKTTLTLSLLKYISEGDVERDIEPLRVIGVDCDPQGGLSFANLTGTADSQVFDINSIPTVYEAMMDVLSGVDPVDSVVSKLCSSETLSNVSILAARPSLLGIVNDPSGNNDGADLDKANITYGENNLLRRLLYDVSRQYTVIVDTGTHPDIVLMAIDAADVVVVPTIFDPHASNPVAQTIVGSLKLGKKTVVVPWNVKGAGWENANYDSLKEGLKSIEESLGLDSCLCLVEQPMAYSYRFRNTVSWLKAGFSPSALSAIRNLYDTIFITE